MPKNWAIVSQNVCRYTSLRMALYQCLNLLHLGHTSDFTDEDSSPFSWKQRESNICSHHISSVLEMRRARNKKEANF
jgi:hypothetical protein